MGARPSPTAWAATSISRALLGNFEVSAPAGSDTRQAPGWGWGRARGLLAGASEPSGAGSLWRRRLHRGLGFVAGSSQAAGAQGCLRPPTLQESILKGRFAPSGRIEGFTAEIGASGSYCPQHATLPVDVTYFDISEHSAPSPFLVCRRGWGWGWVRQVLKESAGTEPGPAGLRDGARLRGT